MNEYLYYRDSQQVAGSSPLPIYKRSVSYDSQVCLSTLSRASKLGKGQQRHVDLYRRTREIL